MTNLHKDQMENRGKDGYGKSVGHNSLKDEFHRIYPVFLESTDQMKNRCKDGYCKSVGFLPLKGSIITEFSPFEIVKLRARKSLRSSYTFALLLSPRL